ncbi:uncharacterized protein FTOL_00971 [Fusarium torulosum]|uniref:DUF4139 domain-containing protein n=1 Tax=Fusarium torulosum TaxID=33205 RepID=A0AAE8LZH8_9HYPO|nr:uncharacterized protein FTOL_00971 [Fusarium torulosum]
MMEVSPQTYDTDVGHKVEYKIRDLGTRSVTLFPLQAQVKRDIKDVPLKPGINEISIVGLTPTIDKNSITVEGSGSATITGISVEFLPNHEHFDEVYPDSDQDDSDSEDENEDDDDDELPGVPRDPSLLEIKKKLTELNDEQQQAREIVGSADSRIIVLDAYSRSMEKKENVDISRELEIYQKEHGKAFEQRLVGVKRERQVTEAINKALKEQSRLTKLAKKAKAKEQKNKAKLQKAVNKKQEQRKRRAEEKRKEKQRLRNERSRCWPKYCYTVQIQLEVNSSYTPASSRRGSMSSEVEFVQRPRSKTADAEETLSCDLVLTYVTEAAFWNPSYDIQLSTVNSTGTLCFDAGLHNTTSETWENCKITLSTSQATSSSLDDTIPVLTPWHLKIASKNEKKSVTSRGDAFESKKELQQSASWRNRMPAPPQATFRRNMFGVDGVWLGDYQMQLMLLEQQNKKRLMMARQENDNPQVAQQMRMQLMQQQAQQQAQQQQQQQQALQQTQNVLHNMSAPPQQAQAQAQAQMQMQMQMQQPQQQQQQTDSGLEEFDFDKFLHDEEGDVPMPDPQPAIEFQESLVEETGFTTTFDLPGLKTLVPKFTVSKQRVARLQFTNVLFSHTIVAKYRPAAYLKAKLKNNSKLTLLRGPASLTLDGSFMGQVKVPRCSPGETFSLGLGVDSAIKVMYPKPDFQRSTIGMFTKEDSSIYVRAITVHNTRVTAKKPSNMLVLDQIPVPEDDRIRVDLLNPRQLTVDGPRQPAGAPGRETAEDKDWGKATASLKKDGQISWDVSLKPGKTVKLELEYSVSMPSGEVAKEC